MFGTQKQPGSFVDVNFNEHIPLDPEKKSKEQIAFFDTLAQHIITEPDNLWHIAKVISLANAFNGQMRPRDKPAASLFFLGPTSTGKTLTAETIAMALFGNPQALTVIHGGDYQLEQQLAKLLGPPPGYVGYEDQPMISRKSLERYGYLLGIEDKEAQRHHQLQSLIETGFYRKDQLNGILKPTNLTSFTATLGFEYFQNCRDELASIDQRISKWTRMRDIIEARRPEIKKVEVPRYDPEKGYISVLLVDEIEKAHRNIVNYFLRGLERGELEVSGKYSEIIPLQNTIIIFTSNIAQEYILKATSGKIFGFSPSGPKTEEEYRAKANTIAKGIKINALKELDKALPPEFISRIGKKNCIVMRQLTPDEQKKLITSIFIPACNKSFGKQIGVTIDITDAGVDYIVEAAGGPLTSTSHARSIRDYFKFLVIEPVHNLLILSGEDGNQIKAGDNIVIDFEPQQNKLLYFLKKGQESSSNNLELGSDQYLENFDDFSELCTFSIFKE
jgi:ATP-dependent Clp protease ATP-binding subunit ClpA